MGSKKNNNTELSGEAILLVFLISISVIYGVLALIIVISKILHVLKHQDDIQYRRKSILEAADVPLRDIGFSIIGALMVGVFPPMLMFPESDVGVLIGLLVAIGYCVWLVKLDGIVCGKQ